MQTVTLKLKQASVVLRIPPKDLQNLVQMGVIVLPAAETCAGVIRGFSCFFAERKKLPEITVVAPLKNENGPDSV